MKKTHIFAIIIFIFLGVLVPWKMINKIYNERTPEGLYENYKWYIAESVELWVKNRDNNFYNKRNVIDWYETPDEKGNRPMDKFPTIIYQEIRNALSLTFEEYSTVLDPDSLKIIISNYLDLRKPQIIEKLKDKTVLITDFI